MEGSVEVFKLRVRDEWLRYLEAERSGARQTLSSWLALFIALLGTFFVVVASLPTQGRPGFPILVTTLFAWAFSVVVVATYTWYQYLGALRSISRDYYQPGRGSGLGGRQVPPEDYWELVARDVGEIFRLMFPRQVILENLAEHDKTVWAESGNRTHNRKAGRLTRLRRLLRGRVHTIADFPVPLRGLFWALAIYSLVGVATFFSYLVGGLSPNLPFSAFALSLALCVCFGIELRWFVRRVARAYLIERKKQRQLIDSS